MRIRVSRNQVPGLARPSSRAVAGYAVLAWFALLLVLFCLWRPGGMPVAGLFSLMLGATAMVHVGWVAVRRRRLIRQALSEATVRE